MQTFFAICLNRKVPLYVYPVPDQHEWEIDAVNTNWPSLIAYLYPLTCSPSQCDPENTEMEMTYKPNSPRLARNTLALGPMATTTHSI